MKKFYFLTLALICAFVANAADLYIFGSFNNWDPQNSTKMTFANNVYTAEIDFSGDCNFALATVQNSEWSSVNANRYGTATDNQVLEAGVATNLSKNENAIKVPYAAKWTITVSADFKTVTATTNVAETYPEKVYMVGYNNTWEPATPFEISGENGVYTAQSVVFTNSGFKLSTAKGTWDGDFNPNGLNVGAVTIDTPASITKGWSNDNTIAIGTYDITIDLVNKTFLAATPTPTGIDEVAADNAAVEYYNLQGVKVANPENGIFIKKQGNKVAKVVL